MSTNPFPLSLKPDLADAARRWEAFYQGGIVDRPVVCVTAPLRVVGPLPVGRYHHRVFDDIERVLDRAQEVAESTFYGGESIPVFGPSLGPDEIAVYCGRGGFSWSEQAPDTNWSAPFVRDWDQALPLRLHETNPLWQHVLALYRRAAERFAGMMLLNPLDLHTNMDLLAAIRGPQQLCLDCVDHPETVDRAMASARALFRPLWDAVRNAGRMDDRGYCQQFYSMHGAAILQCDFSCMISPAMFRRWVLPALEEEAAIVKHALYHWDGPGALVHIDDLVACQGLLALSYVPGAGRGDCIDYLELYKRLQARGKAVHVWGTPEQIKLMHKELRPELVFYVTSASSRDEAESLLAWFAKNT